MIPVGSSRNATRHQSAEPQFAERQCADEKRRSPAIRNCRPTHDQGNEQGEDVAFSSSPWKPCMAEAHISDRNRAHSQPARCGSLGKRYPYRARRSPPCRRTVAPPRSVAPPIASMTSSTVTMPIRWPVPSTTGRPACHISRSGRRLVAAGKRDMVTGRDVRRRRPGRGVRIGGNQPAQRQRPQQNLGRGSECRLRRPFRGSAQPCGCAAMSARRSRWPGTLTNSVVHQRAALFPDIAELLNRCLVSCPDGPAVGATGSRIQEQVGHAVGRHAGHIGTPVARDRLDDLPASRRLACRAPRRVSAEVQQNGGCDLRNVVVERSAMSAAALRRAGPPARTDRTVARVVLSLIAHLGSSAPF